MIPYGRQDVTQADIDAVVEVLRSDWLTQGPNVGRFERCVAAYCGAPHAIAVNTGTAALTVACRALGIGPGDAVWSSPNTFAASVNAARLCGAEVDFVDIDPETGNMDPTALAAKLAEAEKKNTLPHTVIPVHFAGQPCDMPAIAELAARYGFKIIEDACHALGARHDGEIIGDCRHSDMTIFSFHPVKMITTGEGGMIMTADDDLARRARLLASHGITRDADLMQNTPHGPWYYEQIALGDNNRITDIQCALGSSQMARLDKAVSRRSALADRYDRHLKGLPLSPLKRDERARSSWHLYVIRLHADRSPLSRRALFERLRSEGIGVNVHYIPVHLHPYYRQLGFAEGDFPQAESYYAQAITLPLYPTLSQEDQDRVIAALKEALR